MASRGTSGTTYPKTQETVERGQQGLTTAHDTTQQTIDSAQEQVENKGIIGAATGMVLWGIVLPFLTLKHILTLSADKVKQLDERLGVTETVSLLLSFWLSDYLR